MKRCTKCRIIKPLSDFPKDGSRKSGYECRCKVCKAIYMSEYWKRKEVLLRSYENRKKRGYKKQTPIKRTKEQNRKYYLKQDHQKKYEERKLKRKTSPYFRLHECVSAKIRHDLKRGKAGMSLENILENTLNYNLKQLKNHLEKKFLPGMTWGNYGLKGWHIDHIIPASAFNFETVNDLDFKKCWSLKNLQPLWAIDNLSKSNKLLNPHQPSLAIAV